MNDSEKAWVRKYVESGNRLVITGEDATHVGGAAGVVRFGKCPGKDYYAALEKSVADTTPDLEHEFVESLKAETPVRVAASHMVATSIARVDGKAHVFFANFAGLQGGVNPVQTPQVGVEVTVTGVETGHGFFLPFLGEVEPVAGVAGDGGMVYKLPAIEKGAVFWVRAVGEKGKERRKSSYARPDGRMGPSPHRAPLAGSISETKGVPLRMTRDWGGDCT